MEGIEKHGMVGWGEGGGGGRREEEVSKLAADWQENKETEENLRKNKKRNEGEVRTWITKYDQEMGDKQSQITSLQGIYAENKKELMYYEDYFNRLSEWRDVGEDGD